MIDFIDRKLLSLMQNGLPLVSRPFLQIAKQLEIPEQEVIERLAHLKQQGLIKRFGVIVQHRNLGYQANAMVVWNIPDKIVDDIGNKLSRETFVNLCYQRPRRDHWAYNLYCMIHGKNRATVLEQLQFLIETHGLCAFDYQVLFSCRCFKQRGAVYSPVQ